MLVLLRAAVRESLRVWITRERQRWIGWMAATVEERREMDRDEGCRERMLGRLRLVVIGTECEERC